MFEGEYIKGEKNKGKEYDNECGNLIFEGEYLNGKKWNAILRRYEKIEIENNRPYHGMHCYRRNILIILK